MAILERCMTGHRVGLRHRALIGRAPRADIKLQAEGSSKEHAIIEWDGTNWCLRDLSSRNGTKVNGDLLQNRRWSLSAGDTIVFGDPAESWRWIDSAPPKAFAITADGSQLELRDGLLLLPNDSEPRASLYARDLRWQLDVNGAVRTVVDGETIEVEGQMFVLVLPAVDPSGDATRSLTPELASIRDARLDFKVSRDEERVEITIHRAESCAALPSRSFHYMLLTLARQRKKDIANGHSDEEAGWTYTETLASGLLTTSDRLNVDVHRARRLIAKLGWFTDPDSIIERRPDTAQLRLGVGELHIQSATHGDRPLRL